MGLRFGTLPIQPWQWIESASVQAFGRRHSKTEIRLYVGRISLFGRLRSTPSPPYTCGGEGWGEEARPVAPLSLSLAPRCRGARDEIGRAQRNVQKMRCAPLRDGQNKGIDFPSATVYGVVFRQLDESSQPTGKKWVVVISTPELSPSDGDPCFFRVPAFVYVSG